MAGRPDPHTANNHVMNRILPPSIIGGLSVVALVLNTTCFLPLLLVTALVRLVVPVPSVTRACRRAAAWIAESWIGVNVAGLKAGGRMVWEVTEPPHLPRDAWYLITCNHRSWVDIVIVQWLFNRRLPMVKFFLKKELFWVPGLGVAWWALEFPFMQRYPRAVLEKRPELRTRDLETTRRACERFRDAPVCVLNFLEGTRFSTAKRDQQGSPYRHLLLPRAGGAAQVASSLGDRLHALLDVTIVYPDGTPSFWDLVSGRIPRVRVDVAEVRPDPAWQGRDYDSDRAFKDAFQTFIRDLWVAKDATIDAMLARPVPGATDQAPAFRPDNATPAAP
jgi:1-acyl-sn-glycerol-3-phosphate acyltransferase